MKQLFLFFAVICATTALYAAETPMTHLGSEFKTEKPANIQPKDDINIVYGGPDITTSSTGLA